MGDENTGKEGKREKRKRGSDVENKEKKRRERTRSYAELSNLRIPVCGLGSNFLHVIILWFLGNKLYF